MKKSHAEIMLETILDEVKAVHELVEDVPKRGEFNRLEQKVDKLSDDMEVVKKAVKATNRDLTALDQRVTRFEAA